MMADEARSRFRDSEVPHFSQITVQVPAGTWREIIAAKTSSRLLWFAIACLAVVTLVQIWPNKEVHMCPCQKQIDLKAENDALSNEIMDLKKQLAESEKNNVKRDLFRGRLYVTTKELAGNTILVERRDAAPGALETCGAHEMLWMKQASKLTCRARSLF